VPKVRNNLCFSPTPSFIASAEGIKGQVSIFLFFLLSFL